MEKHETAFIKHGFDTIDFVGEDIINDADLATMGINDPQDKHDLMEALKKKGYSQGNNTHHFEISYYVNFLGRRFQLR